MTSKSMTTIGEIADIFDGPHATPKKIEEGPYFLSISSLEKGMLNLEKSARLSEEDFVKWTRRITPRKNDLLFSYETRLGEAALMPDGIKACLGRRMGLLRPKTDKVLPEYLLYAYLSPQFQNEIFSRKIHGCTVDRIALKELPKFPIRIPGLEEQEEVVEILKAIDGKIEVNRRTNQTLEQIAQTLFKSWFVDFDPVRAKVAVREHFEQRAAEHGEPMPALTALEEAQKIAAAATIAGLTFDPADINGTRMVLDAKLAGMDAEQRAQLMETATLFPSYLMESELSEIPKGWAIKILSNLSEKISKGTTPKKSDLSSAADAPRIPFLKVKDISDGGEIDHKGLEKIPVSIHERQLKRSILREGDLLFSIAGTIGRVASVPKSLDNCNANQAVAFIRLENRALYSNYCREFLKSQGLQSDVLSRVVQGVQANVSLKTLGDSRMAIPGEQILTAWNAAVTPIWSMVESNRQECKVLENIRDSLLPKLLSGEIQLNPEPVAEAS